ncbi:MAG TPA: nucleotidyltransferase family protein [Anaerolineales bacterium]|nr:nucleotidyltransferase family protein [Anaerolineales bacterium]
MDTLSELVSEMNRLIAAADANQIHLRAFGGLAIYTHSQDNPRFFRRDSPDVDFMVPKREWSKLESFFQAMGYSPNKQFNLLNGSHRQIYYDKVTGHRIDILVGDFEMCHKLPLNGRLKSDPVTIPLAELFLSKAQIVELNRKDAFDMISLLLNNDLGDEQNGEIGLERIAWLCARDWGLYKTTSTNLKRVEELLRSEELGLSHDERELVLQRIGKIASVIESMPKSLAWKMRNLLGTRLRWYAEVEEVDQ